MILIINNIKNQKYLNIKIIIIIFCIIFIFIYIKNIDKYSCYSWNKTLNETYIYNNETLFSCTINIPKKNCLIDIISPILDFSYFLNINCSIRKDNEKNYLKQISNLRNESDPKRIGFPITIGDTPEIKGKPAMYSDTLLNYVSNNLINFQNKFY